MSTVAHGDGKGCGEAAPKPKRTRKTTAQKLAEAEERVRRLRAEAAAQERKARTKRLIETGAVVERALGREMATPEAREALLAVLLEPRGGRDGGETWTWADALARAVAQREGGE